MQALRFLLIVIAAGSIFASCTVSETDLVGTWILAESSRQHLPQEYKNASTTFTLNEDGSCAALEFVVLKPWSDDLVSVTGTGQWKLDRSGDQAVRLTLRRTTNRPEEATTISAYLFVTPGLGGPELVYYMDDPDSVEAFYFSQVKSIP